MGLLSLVKRCFEESYEIEHHLHNIEYWAGLNPAPTATVWATIPSIAPYRAISGNNDWGTDANDEANVLGSADTPVQAGRYRFDLHRILITTQNSITPWMLRIIWGTTTMAAAIAANQFTCFAEVTNIALGGIGGGVPAAIMMPRQAVGTQIWIQAWNATNNATIDFLVGFHEYEVAH